MDKPQLTLDDLHREATTFVANNRQVTDKDLYSVTDGKTIGTFIEQRFHKHLSTNFQHTPGSASKGSDLPELDVDLKVTSSRQPQSSCPYRSASQKIYGLGYSLLIFVYEKEDNDELDLGVLKLTDSVFIDKTRSADYQTTLGIRDLISHNANIDDIMAFFEDRRLPVDSIEARSLAERVLKEPPALGYLTISNALQWRLQYRRALDQAGKVDGIIRIMNEKNS